MGGLGEYPVSLSLSLNRLSGVHVSPGSAGTLVRRCGITNHHSIPYSLSNISAKNYENRLICVEVGPRGGVAA